MSRNCSGSRPSEISDKDSQNEEGRKTIARAAVTKRARVGDSGRHNSAPSTGGVRPAPAPARSSTLDEQMAGFLIPPWYHVAPASPQMLSIAVFLMGFFTAVTILTAFKAAGQTYKVLKRKQRGGRPSTYLVMIWLDWLVNILMTVLGWLFVTGEIQPSFWLFFTLICLFLLEVQLIAQILINRISLLMIDRRKVARFKWGTALALTVICISVFIVWIPAHLQISPMFILFNNVWDRIEKVLILIPDAGLNIYFLWLVKSTLIDYGLTKYTTLFRFNLVAVFVSVSLDVINVGVMSVQDGWTYMLFQPIAYMIKLYIEMNMADLICRIVLDPGKRSLPSITSVRNNAITNQPPSDYFPEWWDDDGPSSSPSSTPPSAGGRRAATTSSSPSSAAVPLELQGLPAAPAACSYPASPIAGPGPGDEQSLISQVRPRPWEKSRERVGEDAERAWGR